MDRGAWWATYGPWDRKEVDVSERLSMMMTKHSIFVEWMRERDVILGCRA